MIKKFFLIFSLVLFTTLLYAQSLRWHLVKDAGIEWSVKKTDTAHTDHIEMSGRQVSIILTYGTDINKQLILKRQLIFPMLRTIPNDTHASLSYTFDHPLPPVEIAGEAMQEIPFSFSFNGYIKIKSGSNNGLITSREIFSSTDKAAVIEKITIYNKAAVATDIKIPNYSKTDTTAADKGVYGRYLLNTKIYESGIYSLKPNDKLSYFIVYSGRKESDQPYKFSVDYEAIKRENLVKEFTKQLVLETPDQTLNKMFSFAKIRAAESIFDTKNGLMHGPGGGAYYAAIWANDQAEYMNPFFPFLGYPAGNESAINSFKLFASYINKDNKPIPSSVIAEGTDVWHGAGDRGDQAMIAYGASRFALAYADTAEAKKLMPLINWCLDFLRKKKNADGVIASDSDELEGRFPAGKFNLSTNVLAYGALISASHLSNTLGDKAESIQLAKEALDLKMSIDKYFGANVQGFNTYRYYEGNTKLRSWIGLPLVMGIYDRKDETMKALFSKFLWTNDGMLSESGSKTYWDRSLLYAMRGLFNAGATDTTLKYLKLYSEKRLLGEHVPYAIEAWPEGGQRHLSAESGLYCRTLTEGLFGIQPTGFNSFTLTPYLPAKWDKMALRHIRAFNNDFDILVSRQQRQTKIIIKQANGKSQEIMWDGVKIVHITL